MGHDPRLVAFEVAAGYKAKASPASIAFLWTNWEVLYAFRPERIRVISRMASDLPGVAPWSQPRHWDAKGFGGRAQWSLAEATFGVGRGRFTFLTTGARAFGCRFDAHTVLEYDRIDDSHLAYHGTGLAWLPKRRRFLHPLLRLFGSRITIYINAIGAQVAEQISRHPEAVKEAAGESAWLAYQKFIDEEVHARRGDRDYPYELFRPPDHSTQDDLASLKAKLERLGELLTTLHQQGLDTSEFRTSLTLFAHDPRLALVKNKMIVERMLDLLLEKEVGMPPRRSSLEKVEELRGKSLRVSGNILEMFGIVLKLGDAALGDSGRPGIADQSAYRISFDATLDLTEWFLTSYLTSARRSASV